MKNLSKINRKKREKRRKRTAEVFTPISLVNEMLDKLSNKVWKEKEDNTFLDPCCGNGNFLVEALRRKLELGHNPTEALKTIHGLDIMQDNIVECRIRLLKLISKKRRIKKEHIRTVFVNVRKVKDSLKYDMSFKKNYTPAQIDKWYKNIYSYLKEVE